MYVLKDPVLHDTLMKNDYNGLIEFFISTVILNSSDLKEDLTNIDLTCCTLSTSLLLFERMINQFSNAHSYEECNELIHSFVSNYNFNSPEELIVFFNYILETEKASTNANFNSILNVFIERTFLKVCKKHSVTPVFQIVNCNVDVTVYPFRNVQISITVQRSPELSKWRLFACKHDPGQHSTIPANWSNRVFWKSVVWACSELSFWTVDYNPIYKFPLFGNHRAVPLFLVDKGFNLSSRTKTTLKCPSIVYVSRCHTFSKWSNSFLLIICLQRCWRFSFLVLPRILYEMAILRFSLYNVFICSVLNHLPLKTSQMMQSPISLTCLFS